MAKLKRGQQLELQIEKLTYGGRGLARTDGAVVFTPYTAPGDVVRARVDVAKSSYAEAWVESIAQPSADRIAPRCNLFTRCGGCTWQHIPIEVQNHWKQEIVLEALYPLRKLQPEGFTLEPLEPSPQSFAYRNKMEFTFGQTATDPTIKLGFHLPGNWKHILDVTHCDLMPEPLNALLNFAREEGTRQGLDAWNPVRHEGTLRQLLIRWSEAEQKAIVAILTGNRKGFNFEEFASRCMEACPFVKGMAWGLNTQQSDVARPEEILAEAGEMTLLERLENKTFQVSLASFFQTNTLGAERLYSVAREYLELTGRETLLDAYCGTGSIGIFCADNAAHVYGIEIIREAIWDARLNAERNGISHCTFMAGDMADTLPVLKGHLQKPLDRLVVDPPRAGMEKAALQQLVNLRCPVLVYVSCNPTTMSRDLQVMLEAGYKLKKVRPVDMFPQTYHIECVAQCVLES
jgi:23S rRNA (uracil1939-C5)-methyltransferase